MKIPYTTTASIALAFALSGLASAQTDTPPPVKMGLWQTEATVQMSGMPNGMTIPPRTVVRQACMTPDTWKDAFHLMQSHRQEVAAACSASKLQQDAHHVVFDLQCSGSQGFSSSIHVDMQFDSDESMHGTSITTMSGPNAPPGMSINMTMKSKYLSADCGDVKPGEGKEISPGGAPPS